MALLDEHQPRPDNDAMEGPEMYQPSDEDRKAIKKAEDFFKKSKKWRQNYDKDWIDNYKMFRGQQWKEQRPTYRHSEVINMVFQTIQSLVPQLTDSRPKFEFIPHDPNDQEFAGILNDVCESDWAKNNWQDVMTEMLFETHIYGISYAGIYFKPGKEITGGDIKFQTEDPLYCYPDPNCRDINDDKCRGFLIAEPTDIELLKRDYPNGKYVKGDLEDLTNYDKTDIDGYARLRLPIDNTKVMRETSGSIDTLNVQKALLKTYYCFDDSYEEKEEIGPDGLPIYTQVKKFPRGRKIVTANNVLLHDGPLEYEDGKIPVAKVNNYILPREFFGISEVEQIRGPQRIFNKLISFALDVLTLMGNPIWVVSNDSGVDTDNIFNKPGMIIEKNPNSEVRREEGVQLQPYVLQLIDRMREWFDGVAGATDVSRGVQPTGVTAAAAIADLQEAALTRVRLKARNLDSILQKLGQMWLSRTLQFRDAPSMVRVTDNQGATKYFKFHVETVLDENGNPTMDETGKPQKKAVVQSFNPEMGGMNGIQEFPIKGEMDVRVQTGSSLPFAKARKAQDAKDLFNQGVIDAEELLKTLDWPNWQAVLERVKQQQAEAAQAQAAQQARAKQ